MRTANNNFTVEALVAKYHNYVKEHCSKRLDLVRDENGNFVELSTPSSPSGDAGPQLLITLYSMVAGENAKRNIVEPLSKYSSAFFKEALTSDELAYLCEHFREAVSYEFSHQDEWIAGKKIISETPEYIKDMCKSLECVNSKKGDRIYIEDDTLGDVAVLFPLCVILCDGYYDGAALKRIRLFAEGIQYEDVYDLEKESIDLIVAGFGNYPTERDSIELYDALAAGGTMVARFHFIGTLVARINQEFREGLVANKHILSIKKSSVMEEEDLLLESLVYTIVIEKKEHSVVEIIDETSNLSKKIDSTKLSAQILLPGYYLVERPENGIPLSDLIGYYNHDYAEDRVSLEQPIIFPRDLGCSFKDADISYREFKKGTDYGDIEHNPAQDCYSVDFPSILLYGNSKNIYAGIVSKREVPYAVLSPIACFTAKEGIDLRYAASLLYDPMVAKQITSLFEDFCLLGSLQCMSEFLDIIIVPQHDDKEKLVFLANASDNAIREIKEETTNNIENKISVMKADYINEVRMRKHDMMPHILQIKSAENLMRHYMESTNDIVELKQHLLTQIDRVGNARSIISDIVVHLNDEEKFGTTEIVNIDKFLKDVELNHDDSENFTVEYDCDRDSFMKIGIAITNIIEEWGKVKKQGVSYVDFVRQQCKVNLPLYVEIAPIDLRRMVTNIIENARKHAFTDKSRRDYYLGIDLSLNEKTGMYQIDFSNNGNPLPEGMTKEKYGIRGEKAGKTAGTGSGGYIVKSIAEHYGGDYDVFTKEGITTIRIYLPLANKV